MARCAALVLGEAETRVAELLTDHRSRAELPGVMWLDPILRTPVTGGKLGNSHHLAPDINALPFVDRAFLTQDPREEDAKTTTASTSRRYLADCGYPVHSTTEPSRSPLGEIARRNSDTYTGHALACLVAADRYHHLTTEIRPALAAGSIVLCDRYVVSSYVLHHMDGVPLEFIEALNAAADRPDLAFILTVDLETAAARIARRGAPQPFRGGSDHQQGGSHSLPRRHGKAGYARVSSVHHGHHRNAFGACRRRGRCANRRPHRRP